MTETAGDKGEPVDQRHDPTGPPLTGTPLTGAAPPTGGPPTGLLAGARSVAFVHAHPDDETLVTGGLILALVDAGVDVRVLTATRGERGEVVPGPLSPLAGRPELAAVRARELAGALAILGVARHDYLGMPPARAPEHPPRIYRDSGMRWVAPGLAGPAEDSDHTSLVGADLGDVAADVGAYLRATAPDVVVTYDAHGGYGHPDHIRVHDAVAAAVSRVGTRLVFVVSPPLAEGDDVEWWDLAGLGPRIAEALRRHASQVHVSGDEVVHSGGQREPIQTRFGLRPGHR